MKFRLIALVGIVAICVPFSAAAAVTEEVEQLAFSIQSFAAAVSVADGESKASLYAAEFDAMLASAHALYDKALSSEDAKVKDRSEQCLEALAILGERR
jgi:hypothetical protein